MHAGKKGFGEYWIAGYKHSILEMCFPQNCSIISKKKLRALSWDAKAKNIAFSI
jgi:hypothetical protein